MSGVGRGDTFRLVVKPGRASAQEIAEVLVALSELFRSAIGIGCDYEAPDPNETTADASTTIARFPRPLTDAEQTIVAKHLAGLDLFENHHA